MNFMRDIIKGIGNWFTDPRIQSLMCLGGFLCSIFCLIMTANYAWGIAALFAMSARQGWSQTHFFKTQIERVIKHGTSNKSV